MSEKTTSAKHVGLQVVKLSEKPGQRFELDEEALASVLLREDVRHLPVVVVSVAGAYRGGKSFILNFFLRYLHSTRSSQLSNAWLGREDEILQGFVWRGGSDTETKGIHLWPEPVIVTIERTGEKVAVLLMDTQGIFDTESDTITDSTIFALSTLLTSVQIYNLRSNIGGDNLQHLQLFTRYGRLVSCEDNKAFQTLIFLIRDWMSAYEHPFGYQGGEALLNKKLKPTRNRSKELQEVCEHIRSCFEKLQCFLMPYPGDAIGEENFHGTLLDISRAFRNQLLVFVPSLFDPDNLTPKIINGDKVQAQDLLEYFKQYVNVFNSSNMPAVTSMFQATAIASLMGILREARQIYERGMQNKVKDEDSVTTSMLQNWHDKAFYASVEFYRRKRKLNSHEEAEKYLDSFKKDLKGRLQLFVWQNDSKIRQIVLLAKKSYQDTITSVCGIEANLCMHPSDLEALHHQALQAALRVFQQARARVPQQQDDDRTKLTEDLGQRYLELCAVNEQNNKNATLEARELYISHMKHYMDEFTVSSSTLKTQHEIYLEDAIKRFNSQRNRATAYSEDKFLGKLKQDIEKYYDECKNMNIDKNTRALQAAEYTYNNYLLSEGGFQSACFHPKGLEKLHEEGKERALNLFLSHRVRDDQNHFKQQLLVKLENRYGELKSLNHLKNVQAVNRAFAEYREMMDREAAPSPLSLLIVPFIRKLVKLLPDCHGVAKAKALSIFNERRRGGNYANDIYLDDLNQKIENAYWNYVNFFKALGREVS